MCLSGTQKHDLRPPEIQSIAVSRLAVQPAKNAGAPPCDDPVAAAQIFDRSRAVRGQHSGATGKSGSGTPLTGGT